MLDMSSLAGRTHDEGTRDMEKQSETQKARTAAILQKNRTETVHHDMGDGGMTENKTRKRTLKPWRMTATFNTGQSKTIAYATKAAAITSADFELTCGAVEVEVWHAGSDDDR